MGEVFSARDLDKRMGLVIDPHSVPTHNGGGQGVMQARIQPGSDDVHQASQTTQRGAPVYAEQELGQRGFYGSQTVISVNDLPALDRDLDPNVAKVVRPKTGQFAPTTAPAVVSGQPRTLTQILGGLRPARPQS